MSHSTTNAAARELLAVLLTHVFCGFGLNELLSVTETQMEARKLVQLVLVLLNAAFIALGVTVFLGDSSPTIKGLWTFTVIVNGVSLLANAKGAFFDR